jgi:hypothetical protein
MTINFGTNDGYYRSRYERRFQTRLNYAAEAFALLIELSSNAHAVFNVPTNLSSIITELILNNRHN